jgi:hypothetical protein
MDTPENWTVRRQGASSVSTGDRRAEVHVTIECTGLPHTKRRSSYQALHQLIEKVPEIHERLVDALAWYFDDVYDGAPDSSPMPEWVALGVELLGELGWPHHRADDRAYAVEHFLARWNHPNEAQTDDR